jgi:NAD-dependent deacetylase
MSKQTLVVLTGAGMSAESGLGTFRGNGGLWENYAIEEVASIEGWYKNPALVLEFYNARRKAAEKAVPNAGHETLAALESLFKVKIITQNVDTLHEKAGSTEILHLHGRLDQKRSVANPFLIREWTEDLHLGDLAPDGSQWRPHIVWFGEDVPAIREAKEWVGEADFFAVIGTSLQVYPAAGLIYDVPYQAPCFLVDPQQMEAGVKVHRFKHIKEPASTGVFSLRQQLEALL